MRYFTSNILLKILPLFILLSINFVNKSKAQLYFPEDMVKVSAKLLDKFNKKGVPYANVLNMRVRGGTTTDSDGKFSVQADPTDTLTFKSIGYKDRKIAVSEILKLKTDSAFLYLIPLKYEIDEVKVEALGYHEVNSSISGIGKKNTTPIELRQEFDGKPTLLKAVFSPLSYLNYKFNSEEKEKRGILAAMRTEREWSLLSLVYNKEIVGNITGLKDPELDNFMVYCNANNHLSIGASTYEVRAEVTNLLEKYKTEKP